MCDQRWILPLVSFIKVYLLGLWAVLTQFIQPKRKVADFHIKEKRVAIITGGAKGIGFQTARKLARCGVRVVIAAKKSDEGKLAVKKIVKEYPKSKVEFVHLDLSSLKSVRTFANTIITKELPINILINNAGVMFSPYSKTEDGYEEHIQVNYLGHFLLTHLLLDKLKQSATKDAYSRIVNVSSHTHFVGHVNFEDLNSEYCYSSHHAYCQSKTALVMWTYKLQRALQDDGAYVTVNSLHPGVVNTNLYKHVHPFFKIIQAVAFRFLFKSPEYGAETSVYAALSKDLEKSGGHYLDNCAIMESSDLSYNIQHQEELWKVSQKLLGILSEEKKTR